MKRSKIGNLSVRTDKRIFVLDTPLWQMRQSEVLVFSFLDLLQEQANLTELDSELSRIFTAMDKYFAIAMIIENLGENVEYLKNALLVFYEAVEGGEFDYVYSDLNDRNEHINKVVLDIINDSINYSVNQNKAVPTELYKWWQESVIDLNYYTDPSTGEHIDYRPDNAVAIGTTNEDFIEKFKNSACCFAYSKVSESVLAGSKVALIKRKKQIEARNSLAGCDVQLDAKVQDNYLSSGIYQQTNGGDAISLVTALKQNAKNRNKVGALTTAVASIIVACITFLTGLIGAIVSYRKEKLTKEAENSLNNAPAAAPSESDYFNIDVDGDGKNDMPKILAIGALALLYYYFV